MNYVKLPQGVRDSLERECYNVNRVKEALRREFLLSGYEFVQTAGLEYFDTYAGIKSPIPQSKMFKMTDKDGNLIVLRPDMTLAVARIAATKMTAPSAKLCYFSDIYDFSASGNSYREVSQAGVEVFGSDGAFADAQLVAFAIDCLAAAGVENFIIDVGHVGFFKGLLEGSGLSAEEAEEVRGYVNAKDAINTELSLKKYNANGRALGAILALPSLFGGVEVLAEAEKLTENPAALSALTRLKEVFAYLCEMGYEKYVSFDLGTVKSLDYYSGIVFTGLAAGVGAPLLSGGRYDGLAAEFGRGVSAIGFAIGLKRVLAALEEAGKTVDVPEPAITVICRKGGEANGYAAYRKYVKEGAVCDLLPEGAAAEEILRSRGGEKFEATAGGLQKL